MGETGFIDTERSELLASVENFRYVFDKAVNSNLMLRGLLKSTGVYDKMREYIPRIFILLNQTSEGKEILEGLGVYDFISKVK